MISGLTVHEDGPDKLNVSFVQVSSTLCIAKYGFSQFSKFLKPSDKRQDTNFALLGYLKFLHLSDLIRL